MTRTGLVTGLGRRLWRCRRGASAADFALTALPFFVTVMGVVEVAMVLFVNVLLEGGVRDSARFGITGFTPAGTSREQVIRDTIARSTISLVDMTKVKVETLVYRSFSDIGQPEPFTDQAPYNGGYDAGEPFVDVNGNGKWDADMGTAGVGGPGDVVVYTVSYDWPLLTSLISPYFGRAGYFPLKASIAVRNEPFPVAGGGA